MLPAAHRMRRGDDFTVTTRQGVRARSGTVVLHQVDDASGEHAADPALVGFVVGKAVGNSVVRHRVARRLRAQVAPMVGEFRPGSRTVVRALPAAATASSAVLAHDLVAARRRLTRAGR